MLRPYQVYQPQILSTFEIEAGLDFVQNDVLQVLLTIRIKHGYLPGI